ncbi:carbamoyltransferase [Streptomyces pactum]|uniref:Carbamoyltransferase n=1 Tax=Streptomyces pactum TaxID=68249 RepID=A0ABS0NL43_9ACTN|nr:carbamoyltransferase C-terminal domain-containing protein [Streptomyces pactum]MBH5335910.1 carbamoyltransferase [Streptomyces pactum]
MIILGVNAGYHDSSAALVVDGRLTRVVETERVTRRKRAHHVSPAPAIQACLAAEGLTLASVDAIAVGWSFPAFPEYPGEGYTAEERAAFYEWMLDPEGVAEHVYGSKRRRRPLAPLPEDLPPLVFIPHHDAHAYSALLVSGLDRASVIVADGRGELNATSIGIADGSRLDWLKTWPLHQSLGEFYGIAAEWSGMDFWDAGKLMGLAAYGTPTQKLPVETGKDGYAFTLGDMSDVGPNKQHRALRERLETYFAEQTYPYRRGDGREIMAYANFAASVQDMLEHSMDAMFRVLEQAGGSDRLVVSGGVAMNCTMIGQLTRTPGITDVYVPSFPYDAGVSVGAALALSDRKGVALSTERLRSAYLGLDYGAQDIESALAGSGLIWERLAENDLLDRAAAILDGNGLLGWFQGRAEVGQRALGHRSIVGNPRDRGNLVRINELKGREMWRPLAPSVLAEHLGDLFEVGEARSPYDFMLAAARVRPEAASRIPATVHVDGSARPQAVRRETNPRFWGLIDRFRDLTGIPCVLNTSFNLAGEPIVNSPQDAVATFQKSDLTALVIGDYLVTKRS